MPDLNSGAGQYRRDCIRSDGFRMVGKLEALPKASRPELERPDFEWDTCHHWGNPHGRENVREYLKSRQIPPPE